MINKKILAVAVATAFSTNALAAVDLDTGATATLVANESFVTTIGAGGLEANGLLEVTNNATSLDATSAVGFTVNAATSSFVRYDFVNMVVGDGAAPVLTTDGDDVAPGDFDATISAGGAAGDDFVIFEVNDPTETIDLADVLTLAVPNFHVMHGMTATAVYNLYDTGPGAVNELATDLLKSGTARSMVTFGSAINEAALTTFDTAQATVASSFTAFVADATNADPDFATATIARMGKVSILDALVTGTTCYSLIERTTKGSNEERQK